MEKNGCVADRIKQLRLTLNLKQVEFATETGISPSYLSYIESGSRLPSYELLETICVKYNVNVNWILTGNGELFVTSTSNNSEKQTLLLDIDYISQNELYEILWGLKIPLFKYALLERLEELKVEHKNYLKEIDNDNSENKRNTSIG